MKKNLFQDLCQVKDSSKDLSIFEKELFSPIDSPKRSNSEPKSIKNNIIKHNSVRQITIKVSNPLGQLQKDKSTKNSEKTDSSQPNESNKNKPEEPEKSNPIPTIISPNFLNSNFFGFKGRSPYAMPNINNLINTNMNKKKNLNSNNTKNDSKKGNKQNSKANQNKQNKDQKNNDDALVTQLKDKVLEYRCTLCNFVANENDELRKHLALKKHYIFPKKMKKGKKTKICYQLESKVNPMNQTFIYPMKKNYEKKIICRHCRKRFDSIHALNAHLNAHNYKCNICYKLFNTKDELMKHNEMELLLNYNRVDMFNNNGNMNYKPSGKKEKMVIDDWEDIDSSKKEKWESDEEFNKNNEFEQSYAFIEDNDENFDFNKMVKINEK